MWNVWRTEDKYIQLEAKRLLGKPGADGWQSKAIPVQVCYRSTGFQEVKDTRFQDNRRMKVVRLSALRTGRLYPRKCSWYSFPLETESTPGTRKDIKISLKETA